jgi:hypothetical protein
LPERGYGAPPVTCPGIETWLEAKDRELAADLEDL